MQQMGGQADLFFWLTVEGYRVTAQQQLEVLQSWQKDGRKQSGQTKGLLKAAALGVYEQYLSEKVSPQRQGFLCSSYSGKYNPLRHCQEWGPV